MAEKTSEFEDIYVLEPRAKYLLFIGLVMDNGIIALEPAVKAKVLIANLKQTLTGLNKGMVFTVVQWSLDQDAILIA